MLRAFAGDLRGARAAVHGRRDDAARWVRAYVAAACGSFPEAERRARLLLGSPHVGVAAALTLGSVLRQTARHRSARPIDARALRDADAGEQRAHALISLAADAVGVGDRRGCSRRLRAAEDEVPARAWRAQVRLAWVQTEGALLAGDTARAVAAAELALARARRAGARRHEAKSLLFLGVARREAHRAATPRRAREAVPGDIELRLARDLARAIGARPVAQVANAVLHARR